MSMLHIVILADPLDEQKAGVYTYTKSLIENLLKIDRRNRYTFIHKKAHPFFENKNHYIVKRWKIPGYESFRRFFLIPKLIKKIKADLVLEPCHIGPFRLPKNIKKAVTVHDLTPVLFPQFHSKRSVIIHKLLFKKTLKNADLILVPSETTKKDIQNYCRTKAKIIITPLGVNKPQKAQKKSPYKKPYFLYLGTIEPRKNLNLLIDAFLELKKSHKLPHKLVLAGEIGWKAEKIIKKAKQSKDIILPGYLSEKDKALHYKHADLFIYPSLYEGFGLPPLEAMSYKIPVICGSGGSLKEIFESSAVIFDANDKEALKFCIMQTIKSPELKKMLIKNGLKMAKKYTWPATAKATLNAF